MPGLCRFRLYERAFSPVSNALHRRPRSTVVGSRHLRQPTNVTADLAARLQAALGDAYLIERELGGGGMSRVFVAQDRTLARRVVVKVLPPEMAAAVNIERFRREIQLAASLQHPH